MAAARYWRLVQVETYGYRADLELAEIALYEGASRVDGSATLTSALAPISGTLANLSDADAGTTALFSGADVAQPGFALQWDFGSGVTKDISEIGLTAASDRDNFVYDLTLQYSSDAATWVTRTRFDKIVHPGSGSVYTITLSQDRNFSQTSLLLHGDGTDGSTTITDDSPLGLTVTVSGNARIRTAESKFGGAAMYFDGTGDFMTAAANAGLQMQTGDYTIECNIYPEVSGAYQRILSSTLGTFSGDTVVLRLNNTGALFAYAGSGSGIVGASPALNTWSHIALVRKDGTATLFLNGVPQGTSPTATGIEYLQYIGGYFTGNPAAPEYFTGYIDEVRITKGFARYTDAFDPPIAEHPDEAFTSTLADRKLTSAGASLTVTEYNMSGATQVRIASVVPAVDPSDGGVYHVVGTVKEKNLPTNTPLHRRVRLIGERDGRFLRETWSDATTGEYEFKNVRGDITYTVVSYDHTTLYRAVIADNLLAELMP